MTILLLPFLFGWFSFFLSFSFFFFSFSVIAVAETPNTMSKESGEYGHPYLVPDIRGKAFSFSLLTMMLAESLSQQAFTMLR